MGLKLERCFKSHLLVQRRRCCSCATSSVTTPYLSWGSAWRITKVTQLICLPQVQDFRTRSSHSLVFQVCRLWSNWWTEKH